MKQFGYNLTGAGYQDQAVQSWKSGNYFSFGAHELQAFGQAGLTLLSAVEVVPAIAQAAVTIGREFAPIAENWAENFLQRQGGILYAVPPGDSLAVPNIDSTNTATNSTTSGFISDLHGAIQENINAGELAQYKMLDPEAKIGLTGSSATGTVGNPNKATFGQSIDPNKFDLDLFVQSDTLLEIYGPKLQAAPVLRQTLVDSYPDLFQGLKPGKDGLSIKFRPTGQPPNGSIMFDE